MRKFFIPVVFILVLFVSCSTQNKVASVGDMVITQSDINDTRKINESISGDTLSDSDAFLITLQRFMDMKMAEIMGVKFTDSLINVESENIKAMMDSTVINKIKDVFKDDKDGYNRVFLKPFIARQKIEEIFYYDSLGYQKEAWDTIHWVKNEIEKGKIDFDNPPDGFFKFEVAKNDTTNKLLYMFIDNYFASLPKGENIGILQDNAAYVVAKKYKNKYIGLIYPKKRFDDFYIEEMKKIGVKIYDKDLKQKTEEVLQGNKWGEIIS